MITTDSVIDALKRFDVDDETLARWEHDLGLRIPVDGAGQKCYSIHHINLFKNVRKHLALGRSMAEVREVLSPLPESSDMMMQDPVSGMSETQFVPISVNREYAASAPLETLDSNETFSETMIVREGADAAGLSQQALSELELQTSLDAIFLHDTVPRVIELEDSGAPKQGVSSSAVIPGSSIKQHTRFATKVQPVVQEGALDALLVPPIDAVASSSMLPAQTSSQALQTVSSSSSSSSRVKSSQNLASQQSGLLSVINRLIDEKELQQKRLIQIEKLNSHLYNANALFQQRLKTVTSELDSLRNSVSDTEVTKLLNDKSKLHKQLLETERLSQHRMLELAQREKEAENLQARLEQMMTRLKNPVQSFDPASFVGDWHEQGQLLNIRFDNFGMNIEPRRNRTFKIPMVPDVLYGNTAVIHTEYCYDANPMWQRRETMTLCHVQEGCLEGELLTEYVLDGVPVAQAVYKLTCQQLR